MKISTTKTTAILLICLPFLFYSCKKDTVSSSSNGLKLSSDNISDADAPGIYRTTSGDIKLVLQPGNQKGQDAWIEYSPDDASYASHNSGSIDQFKVLAWTDGGKVIISRSFLKFADLSQIPTNSYVKQATLFLYGLNEGSVHLPQGNSYYPGSPYNSFGPNDTYVQKATSAWDENSVTWNTMPSSSVNGESLIPPSKKQWNNNSSADVSQIVRAFVKNPSKNYGFILSLTNENIYHSYGFYSSESSNSSKRPKLVIIYSN
jgi:hypothetical protein